MGFLPYQLVYNKVYHLLVKLVHKAYRAIKIINLDQTLGGNKRLFKLNELEEMHLQPYGT